MLLISSHDGVNDPIPDRIRDMTPEEARASVQTSGAFSGDSLDWACQAAAASMSTDDWNEYASNVESWLDFLLGKGNYSFTIAITSSGPTQLAIGGNDSQSLPNQTSRMYFEGGLPGPVSKSANIMVRVVTSN